MLEEIEQFKQAVLEKGRVQDYSQDAYFFQERIKVEFQKEFPEEPHDEYTRTYEWHAIIGSGLNQSGLNPASEEVQSWMRGRVAEFMESFWSE